MSENGGKLSLRLYEITDRFLTALEALPDSGLDEVTIFDTLESIEGELVEKGRNVAAYCLNLEAECDAVEAMAAKLKDRAKIARSRTDSLRQYLFVQMQRAGITEIKAIDGTFSAKIKNNPPSVDCYAPEFIPPEFMKVPEPPPPSPIKSAIKDAIKSGVDVPGCRLTQSQRLDIK